MSATTVTLTVSPASPTLSDQAVLLEARVALVAPLGGETPIGSIWFWDGTINLGAVNVNAFGDAALTLLAPAAGSHSFTAGYEVAPVPAGPSDAVFDPSLSPAVTHSVLAFTDVMLAASLVAPPFGQPVTLTATLAWFALPGGELPTGVVTFMADVETVLGTADVNASGEAALTTAALQAGPHSLTAEYGGDALFGPSVSAVAQHQVGVATSSTAMTVTPSPTEVGRSTSILVTVALALPSTAPASGQVTLLDGATPAGTATLDAGGKATITTAALTVGSHALTVAYEGNSSIQPSTSPGVALLVLPTTSLGLVVVEDALHAWVVAALGLTAVWSHPNVPAPATPYAWLSLVGPVRLGNGELVDGTNLANPAGQEIERTAIEHEEWTFSVEVIAGATSGASAARAVLAGAAMRMRLPSALDAVRAADLAVVDFGDTQDLTALFNTTFESRARMDVRLRSVNTAMEKTGYIEKVGVSSPFGSWQQLPP